MNQPLYIKDKEALNLFCWKRLTITIYMGLRKVNQRSMTHIFSSRVSTCTVEPNGHFMSILKKRKIKNLKAMTETDPALWVRETPEKAWLMLMLMLLLHIYPTNSLLAHEDMLDMMEKALLLRSLIICMGLGMTIIDMDILDIYSNGIH